MKTKQWTKPLVVGLTIPTLMLASSAFAAQSDKTIQRSQTTQQERMENRQGSASHIYRASQLVGAGCSSPHSKFCKLGCLRDFAIFSRVYQRGITEINGV